MFDPTHNLGGAISRCGKCDAVPHTQSRRLVNAIDTLHNQGQPCPVLDTWSVPSQPYNAIGGARQMTCGQRELFKLLTPGAL
ncbi:polymorphic toxin type 46 domain-containing protein [Pseudomonas sp. NPDC089407]|uniref:polymorphic toxin type 46 domain-containing protein n=1 Tax=Pseudomonas sp. NPDC089407 TaxID=3364464 RepID=UPI00384C2326